MSTCPSYSCPDQWETSSGLLRLAALASWLMIQCGQAELGKPCACVMTKPKVGNATIVMAWILQDAVANQSYRIAQPSQLVQDNRDKQYAGCPEGPQRVKCKLHHCCTRKGSYCTGTRAANALTSDLADVILTQTAVQAGDWLTCKLEGHAWPGSSRGQCQM